MDVTVEELSPVQRLVRIEIGADAVSKAYAKAVRKVGARARIPGFRPGKAPRRVLERRYGGLIREQVLEQLLTTGVPEGIEQTDLHPIGEPELSEVGELVDGNPLTASVKVEVLPELQIGGYEGATVAFTTVEPDDEDIDEALARRAEAKAVFTPTEEGAKDGDEVTVSYTLTPNDEDAAAGAVADAAEGRQFVVGRGGVGAWLEEAVADKAAGATLVDDALELPEGDTSGLGGHTVKLELKIDRVERKTPPPIDDELAKQYDHEDLDGLREDVRAELAKQAERMTKRARRDAALGYLLEHNEVVAPEALISRQIDARLGEVFGMFDPQMLRSLGPRLNEFRDTLRPEATSDVQRALLIRALRKAADIAIAPEAVDARVEEILADLDEGVREQARGQLAESRDRIESELIEDAVIAHLEGAMTLQSERTLPLRDGHKVGKPDAEPDAEADGAADAADVAAAAAEPADASAASAQREEQAPASGADDTDGEPTDAEAADDKEGGAAPRAD